MCFFKRARERLKFHRKPLSFPETPAPYFIVFTSEPLNQPLLFCEPLSHVLKHGMDSRKALQAIRVRGGGREEGMSPGAAWQPLKSPGAAKPGYPEHAAHALPLPEHPTAQPSPTETHRDAHVPSEAVPVSSATFPQRDVAFRGIELQMTPKWAVTGTAEAVSTCHSATPLLPRQSLWLHAKNLGRKGRKTNQTKG